MLRGTAGRKSNDPGACFEDSTLCICSSAFGKGRLLIPDAVAGVVPLELGMGTQGLPLGWVLSVGPGLSHMLLKHQERGALL